MHEKRRKTCVFRCASFLYTLRGGGDMRTCVSTEVDISHFLRTIPLQYSSALPGVFFPRCIFLLPHYLSIAKHLLA